MIVFSAGGTTAVPVEMARGARARGVRVIAVTSIRQSLSADVDEGRHPPPRRGATSSSTSAPRPRTPWWRSPGVDTPVGPGSTLAAVAIVQCHQGADGELLAERERCPRCITRGSVVGSERSRALFDDAYSEHARRLARAIGQRGGG